MDRKNTIILILSFVIIFLIGCILYFFLKNTDYGKGSNVTQVAQRTDEEIKNQQAEEAQTAYNEQFPDLIDGVINIVSDEKTIITTKIGEEYLISPARPMSFYEDSGIKNSSLVEIRGKILENGQIHLGSITPVK